MTARHRPLILLVDDYEDALDIYGAYLRHTGFDVVVGRNGEEAVAAARAHRPDLILLDLRMPVMSGTDALHALRGDPTFAHVPIVALTAHALEEERLRAFAAGFNDVVTKPCLPDDLVVIITRLLSSREGAVRAMAHSVHTNRDERANAVADRESSATREPGAPARIRCESCHSRLDVLETPSGGRTISVVGLGSSVEANPAALERFDFGASHEIVCPACNHRIDLNAPYRAMRSLRRETGR